MHGPIDDCDQYVRLLTTSLTEPAALPPDALRDSIGRQVEHSETATRAWVAAVRRVQRSGLLTNEQADALVVEIVFAWQVDLDQKAGLFGALGEDAMARGTRTGQWNFFASARQPFVEMMYRLDGAERRSTVAYPPWDDGADAPALPGAARPGRRDGDDHLRIVAVQRSRALGEIDREVAWFLLDRLAEATVSAELAADPVLQEIEERMDCVEFDGGGPPEGSPPGSRDGASETWLALDAARDRRVALFKRRVLLEAGEDEMVRLMKERPGEFRERMEAIGRTRQDDA